MTGVTARPRVRTKNATTRRRSTATARGAANSTDVPAVGTSTRERSSYNSDSYMVIVQCPTGECGFVTDVYGAADLAMWQEEGLLWPDCPKCGKTLIKSPQQYIELD